MAARLSHFVQRVEAGVFSCLPARAPLAISGWEARRGGGRGGARRHRRCCAPPASLVRVPSGTGQRVAHLARHPALAAAQLATGMRRDAQPSIAGSARCGGALPRWTAFCSRRPRASAITTSTAVASSAWRARRPTGRGLASMTASVTERDVSGRDDAKPAAPPGREKLCRFEAGRGLALWTGLHDLHGLAGVRTTARFYLADTAAARITPTISTSRRAPWRTAASSRNWRRRAASRRSRGRCRRRRLDREFRRLGT